MCHSLSRRGFLMAVAAAAAIGPQHLLARQDIQRLDNDWSLPLRDADGVPGDGLLIRHGFACENTWYYLGRWHAAEDWYRLNDVDTAGAQVLAVHAGEVMWIGSDYPGRVVLVLHEGGLYSMYGHLDYAVDVREGDRVVAGQVIGRVLDATAWRAPNHLHFEIRDFFFNTDVNGDTPKYDYACGYRCPPGPGYWPFDDPRHPSEMGWRNPSHVIHRGFSEVGFNSEVIVAEAAAGLTGPIRSAPDTYAPVTGEIVFRPGDRFLLRDVSTDEPASMGTSALGYRVWYQLEFDDGSSGWLPALIADDRDIQADGRPSSLRPLLLPVT